MLQAQPHRVLERCSRIYRTDGESDSGIGCYVAQYDSLGGDILENDIGEGPRSFNFATPGTVAEFSGGCTWTLSP